MFICLCVGATERGYGYVCVYLSVCVLDVYMTESKQLFVTVQIKRKQWNKKREFLFVTKHSTVQGARMVI